MSGGLLTGSWSFCLSSRYLTLIIIIIIIDRRSCLLYIVKNICANIYRLLIKEYILLQSYFRPSFGQNHLTNTVIKETCDNLSVVNVCISSFNLGSRSSVNFADPLSGFTGKIFVGYLCCGQWNLKFKALFTLQFF